MHYFGKHGPSPCYARRQLTPRLRRGTAPSGQHYLAALGLMGGRPRWLHCDHPAPDWGTGNGICLNSNISVPVSQGNGTYGVVRSWDLSKMTYLKLMFNHASKFNQPLGTWDVKSDDHGLHV